MLFMTPRKSMVRLPKKIKNKFDSAELKVWNVRSNNTKSLLLYNLELRIQWPEKAPDNCIRRKKWKSKNNIYKCKISLLKCTISVTKLRPQLHTKWTIWVVTFGTRWWLCNDLMRQNYAHFEIDVALMVAKA